jgi:carboxyl-terminal processing protease
MRPAVTRADAAADYADHGHHHRAGLLLHPRELLRRGHPRRPRLAERAFAAFAQELETLGTDPADATLPALSGNRDSDWSAFAAMYTKVISGLHASATAQQDLAAATINGMLASLDDNHTSWDYPHIPPGIKQGQDYGLGLTVSASQGMVQYFPQEALPPLYITAVQGGPAAQARLRPGDVVESVNGSAPFSDGILSQGAAGLLYQSYPQDQPVTLTLHRPATGQTWTVTLAPALYTPTAAATALVTSRLLDGDIAYVKLAAFLPGAATQVLSAITALGQGQALRGVILDLRGNPGGDPSEDASLLGAWIHGAAYDYDCDAAGNCTPNYTSTTTPLLHLPLAVLTDRNCASACDAFTSAVKDLHLGTLIGTRTAGYSTGPGSGYLLDDGSALELPARHEVSADHEIINMIGVAPDYYLPLTATDASTGHDPDITKALAVLGR